jgi:hypothetical protein
MKTTTWCLFALTHGLTGGRMRVNIPLRPAPPTKKPGTFAGSATKPDNLAPSATSARSAGAIEAAGIPFIGQPRKEAVSKRG